MRRISCGLLFFGSSLVISESAVAQAAAASCSDSVRAIRDTGLSEIYYIDKSKVGDLEYLKSTRQRLLEIVNDSGGWVGYSPLGSADDNRNVLYKDSSGWGPSMQSEAQIRANIQRAQHPDASNHNRITTEWGSAKPFLENVNCWIAHAERSTAGKKTGAANTYKTAKLNSKSQENDDQKAEKLKKADLTKGCPFLYFEKFGLTHSPLSQACYHGKTIRCDVDYKSKGKIYYSWQDVTTGCVKGERWIDIKAIENNIRSTREANP